MNIGVLISIREKSKRFPGKVLKKIGEQTVTEHLIDRLKNAQGLNRIIIATSDDPRDKVFKQFADLKGIEIYFGDPEDKLLRYLQVCNYFQLDAVIIVDGDDILCFPEIVTETANELKKQNTDAIFWEGLALGAVPSALTKSALEKVLKLKDESDTEVWGGYFTDKDFNVSRLKSNIRLFNHPETRLTLDYEEDLQLLKAIFSNLESQGNLFTSEELMNLLINEKPELNEINSSVQKLYEEHLKKSAPVKMKGSK